MVNAISYTQEHCQKKQNIKAEKLGNHWKLKDQSATALNQI